MNCIPIQQCTWRFHSTEKRGTHWLVAHPWCRVSCPSLISQKPGKKKKKIKNNNNNYLVRSSSNINELITIQVKLFSYSPQAVGKVPSCTRVKQKISPNTKLCFQELVAVDFNSILTIDFYEIQSGE